MKKRNRILGSVFVDCLREVEQERKKSKMGEEKSGRDAGLSRGYLKISVWIFLFYNFGDDVADI